mgnify:CR=1 FL=1
MQEKIKKPEGLNLTSDGQITWTPPYKDSDEPVTYTFTVLASTSENSCEIKLAVKVYSLPEFKTQTMPKGSSGKSYRAAVQVSGTEKGLVWEKSLGNLSYGGFSLELNNDSREAIVTGSSIKKGSYTFTLTAYNKDANIIYGRGLIYRDGLYETKPDKKRALDLFVEAAQKGILF